MLRIQTATRHTANNKPIQTPRIGLAAAGGGPLGAIYELGALRALDESVDGLNLHQLDTYVGVSAGALIAASLANQITTAQMCRIFMSRPDAEFAFRPENFLKPAYREYFRQFRRVPAVTLQALVEIVRSPSGAGSETLNAISRLLPTGLFNNTTINTFIEQVLSVPGRTNDFRELNPKLFVVAVDLDTGAAVRFGEKANADVPISLAVQASTALPGLYPPVTINNRDYVDGALRRTLHASVALKQDLDLLIAINPLVPYDSEENRLAGHEERRLSRTDLYLVLSQTFRSIIQSRMQIGIEQYKERYPETAIILAEPNRNDDVLFFTNMFSFSSRVTLCEHAYQTIRIELRKRRDELNQFFAPYGMSLNDQVLNDENRSFAESLNEGKNQHAPVTNNLRKTLDRLHSTLDSMHV